ncbi:MAG: divergent PAP2 family protein [Clostridiales bacterium]|nr:divergent PAP2 family protein [Clostridiales bacterium]
MEYLYQLIDNSILITGLCAWILAQILKTFTYLIVNREFKLERLFGDGGMPSGHSATVTSVAVMTGLSQGFDSPVFAVAAILAIVVMHDAMGVRLETGKQAKAINDMQEFINKMSGKELTDEEKLKEFVGHTPLQVCMGALLGIVVGIVVNLVLHG